MIKDILCPISHITADLFQSHKLGEVKEFSLANVNPFISTRLQVLIHQVLHLVSIQACLEMRHDHFQ